MRSQKYSNGGIGLAKKMGGKTKMLAVAFIFAVLIILAHYMYFESQKLEGCGVSIFHDWRSYIAYVLSKVPYIKDKVHYTPMKVGNPSAYYRDVLSGVVEDVGKKLEELEKKEHMLKSQEDEYKRLLEVLNDMKSQWKIKFEEVSKSAAAYEDIQKNVQDLRNILKSGDPEELSTILVQDTITASTIAAAVDQLPDDLKAEILQALAKKDPLKAAKVTEILGSIEEKIKEIKNEQKRLEELLKKVAKEKSELENEKVFVNAIVQYVSMLTAQDIVRLIMDLKLNIDVIAALVSKLPPDKSQEILTIFQNEYPTIFKRLIEKGVGE